MPRNVFISYSHQDRRWLKELNPFLEHLSRDGTLVPWDDTQIRPGELWRDEIAKALESAEIAILLVSQDFLASQYIADNELPPLLDAAKQRGVCIFWIAVSACLYKRSAIEVYQAAHDPARPLDSLASAARKKILTQIFTTIAEAPVPKKPQLAPLKPPSAVSNPSIAAPRVNEAGLAIAPVDEPATGAFREALPAIRQSLTTHEPLGRQDADRLLNTVPKSFTDHRIRRLAEWLSDRDRFDARFVNLSVVLAPVREGLNWDDARPDRSPRENKSRYRSLLEVLADHQDQPAFIVLGDPGSGKSMLLKHLEHEVAVTGLDDSARPIPFWAPLNDYQSVKGVLPSPLEWLAARWTKALPNLPSLVETLDSRPVLLLLDALNEIAHADDKEYRDRAADWRRFVDDEIRTRPNARAVFTCRSINFSRHLSGGERTVPEITVQPLDDAQMQEFLASYLPNGISAESVFHRIAGDTRLMDLMRIPFYLRMLAFQVTPAGELPTDRALLFCGFVRRQLRRNIDDETVSRLLTTADLDFLNDPEVEQRAHLLLPEEGPLIPSLTSLGWNMDRHKQTAETQVRVPEQQAYEMMDIPVADGRAILDAGYTIAVLDRDRIDRSVTFFHQLFQDFFAGRAISNGYGSVALHDAGSGTSDISVVVVGRSVAAISDDEIGNVITTGGSEESVLIASSMTPYKEGFIRSVLYQDPVLAARSAATESVSDALKNDIRAALITRMHNGALEPKLRAEAGQALSEIGDTRPGVGLTEAGLPDIVWCNVPAGPFLFGDDDHDDDEKPRNTIALAVFRIAKYPITFTQYQSFIDAPDGYHDARWWQALHKDGKKQQKSGPGEQRFQFGNHPRECVSWYDAMAFCAWLTYRMGDGLRPLGGEKVTLPTEEQWEKAARGINGLIYPYGNEFDPAKGNVAESGIGQTTAVGLFPDGKSPFEVEDMSGNVWEWARTDYITGDTADSKSSARRVLRGGSWGVNRSDARTSFRYDNYPSSRGIYVGFRVCLPLL